MVIINALQETTIYQRNEKLAELASRRAQGVFELYEQYAPF